jgi:ApaG protein
MATPEMSDVTTAGVRVGATGYFLPDESDPDERKFLFGYTIVIKNDSPDPVQLVSRYWLIIDAAGRQDEVRGPASSADPAARARQAYKYQSFCPLKTPGARWRASTRCGGTTARRSR